MFISQAHDKSTLIISTEYIFTLHWSQFVVFLSELRLMFSWSASWWEPTVQCCKPHIPCVLLKLLYTVLASPTFSLRANNSFYKSTASQMPWLRSKWAIVNRSWQNFGGNVWNIHFVWTIYMFPTRSSNGSNIFCYSVFSSNSYCFLELDFY